MKRASPVLAFVCLAAFDVLLVAAGVAFLLRPTPRRTPISASESTSLAAARRPPTREVVSTRAGSRRDAAQPRYRPKLPAAYSAPLPPRTIAGWVFLQEGEDWTPVERAMVFLLRGRVYDVRAMTAVGDALHTTLTAPDGAFSFGALEPGEYTLHVYRENQSGRAIFCEIADDDVGPRPPGWKFVFGSACISGTVYGLEGAPLDGIGYIAGPAHSDGWCISPDGVTNEDGRFTLVGLPADEYVLEIGSAPGEKLAWPRRRLEFTLAQDQDLRLDAGSAEPPASLAGHVRDAHGAALAAPGLRLEFRMRLADAERSPQVAIEARLKGTGGYEVQLPAGIWTPRLFGNTGEPLELEPLTVVDSSEGVDLSVGGASVRGTLRLRGTQEALDGTVRSARVEICRPGASGANVLHAAPVDAQGRFEVGFLAPGEWELRVVPEWAARQDHPLKFLLGADETGLDLEVPVEKP